jgi:hypothetical protein
MAFQNPTEHNGYTISAIAFELLSGKWRGSYVIDKEGVVVRRETTVTFFESQADAEQHTISLGCRLAGGEIPGLL